MGDSFFFSLVAIKQINGTRDRENKEPSTLISIGVVAIFAKLIYHSWIIVCLLASLSCVSDTYHPLGIRSDRKKKERTTSTYTLVEERSYSKNKKNVVEIVMTYLLTQQENEQVQWMSGEKKRHRCRHGLILIEENLITNSTSTTTTIRTEEQKHTENTHRKWYNDKDLQLTSLLPNETISDKIDRVLKKINAWTNDDNQESLFNYDNIHQRQENSNSTKPTSTSLINSFRRRCSSTTRADNPSMIKTQQISTHRPYSMAFIDEPSTNNYSYEGQNRKVKEKKMFFFCFD
jgi:hypothetical protein